MNANHSTRLDVAKAASVSPSTVSRALNQDPCISEKTRRRIERIAARLSYFPNPIASALARQQKRAKPQKVISVIGYFVGIPVQKGWPAFKDEQTFRGAQTRSSEMGYKIEVLWADEPDMSPQRLNQILQARGIQGVILGPFLQAKSSIHRLDWSELAAVAYGYEISQLAMHRVTDDQYFAMCEVMRRIRTLDASRPALVLSRQSDQYSKGMWTSAFLYESYLKAPTEAPALFKFEGSGREGLRLFVQWWNQLRRKPEVLIFANEKEADACLGAARLKCPDHVMAVVLNKIDPHSSFSGIRPEWFKIGEEACSLLISQLEENRLGPPETANTFLVRGRWEDGKSIIQSGDLRSI